MSEVVASVIDIVNAKATAGRVGLVTDVRPPELTIHADHDRLAQILINLVDNAVKYTPENGWVTVRARALARRAGRADGAGHRRSGIPRADLPRIIERFYRVDKARSRELGGTGLGLAIVKHLVLAHGGDLAIESEQGEGTTVRVALPGGGPAIASQMPLPIPGV